jgi:hypothetical protein
MPEFLCRVWLALVSSYLMGFGDSLFQAKVCAMLGMKYAQHSAPAFALFRFVMVSRKCVNYLSPNAPAA